MNEVIKAMKERRSVRSFKPEHVPQETLEQIMEAGLYAASGMNRQSAILISITNEELRNKISKANAAIMGIDKDPFYGAPDIIIVLADKSAPTYVYDGSLVMGNLMLAAHTLGVSSCWIHRAKEEFETEEFKALLKSLGIEGDYEGIGHCALGYAADPVPEAKPRRIGRIFHIN